jgi:KDO2-lipid IV(A) lauroyltransferase
MAKKKKSKFKKYRRKVRYKVMYGFIKFMIFTSNQLSRVFWVKLCGVLGGFSYFFLINTRKLVKEHLTLAYKSEKTKVEIQSMTREVFRMLGRNAGDVIRGFKIQELSEYEPMRVINGAEHLESAFQSGKGVIFLTAHVGAFEFLATELAFRGYKPFIIGSRMKDKKLNELLNQQRNKLGATAVERGKDTIKLMKNLKSGGTVAILIDQDTKVKSVFVNFFGMTCATPIGATILALRTGAVVIPVFIHLRDDYMQEINCYPQVEFTVTGNEEVDLVVNTQKLTNYIEAEVRKYPSQWVWMHKRWKTKPSDVTV